MYKMKLIPVIIGANATIYKITQTIPERHTGIFDVKELKKTAILGTAQIFYYGKY